MYCPTSQGSGKQCSRYGCAGSIHRQLVTFIRQPLLWKYVNLHCQPVKIERSPGGCISSSVSILQIQGLLWSGFTRYCVYQWSISKRELAALDHQRYWMYSPRRDMDASWADLRADFISMRHQAGFFFDNMNVKLFHDMVWYMGYSATPWTFVSSHQSFNSLASSHFLLPFCKACWWLLCSRDSATCMTKPLLSERRWWTQGRGSLASARKNEKTTKQCCSHLLTTL